VLVVILLVEMADRVVLEELVGRMVLQVVWRVARQDMQYLVYSI
jgi:hypothetical protein